MALHLVPLTQRQANDAITRWHRHNASPRGDIFRVGVAKDGVLVCVGTAGRPVARHLDDGSTIEVTRVSSDGTFNTVSMVYGALARAAFALGYTRVITYTQCTEQGSSLRAANWKVVAERPPRAGWSSVSRPRSNAKYQVEARTLWEA